MTITYGNMQGQHFTRWRIELLEELLELINSGNGCGSGVVTEDVKIWYDEECDFHHLSFRANEHYVNVRLYIVWSSKIDGKDGWMGCPRNMIYSYSSYLIRTVKRSQEWHDWRLNVLTS